MSEEKPKNKSHVIGVITLDRDGVWTVSYYGYHNVEGKKYFGNGAESSRNLRQLLNVAGSRMSNSEEIYTDKIKEVEDAPSSETNSSGSRDSIDDGTTVS